MATKPTAAVDLDGTLAAYDGWKGLDHIGDPLPGAKEFLTELRAFARVLIFTTRTSEIDPVTGEHRGWPSALGDRVRAWLYHHGLPFDEVWTGQGKPIASVYIDDRAIPCMPQRIPDAYPTALFFARELCGEYAPRRRPDAMPTLAQTEPVLNQAEGLADDSDADAPAAEPGSLYPPSQDPSALRR